MVGRAVLPLCALNAQLSRVFANSILSPLIRARSLPLKMVIKISNVRAKKEEGEERQERGGGRLLL